MGPPPPGKTRRGDTRPVRVTRDSGCLAGLCPHRAGSSTGCGSVFPIRDQFKFQRTRLLRFRGAAVRPLAHGETLHARFTMSSLTHSKNLFQQGLLAQPEAGLAFSDRFPPLMPSAGFARCHCLLQFDRLPPTTRSTFRRICFMLLPTATTSLLGCSFSEPLIFHRPLRCLLLTDLKPLQSIEIHTNFCIWPLLYTRRTHENRIAG